ncbi:hypothetical protein MATL_G00198450 [Megalops atlanticus]|uniref:Uncharacterized protein n=1 Tax=Megalops atlanticus TaxID=7932 RepID=A0A9D3T133_MEGAT|nr:hypothetical protein MATL_G00198450 [Megalops atlanticus]
MSRQSSSMDTQSLLLSMLQRMRINQSTRASQGGQLRAQPHTTAGESNGSGRHPESDRPNLDFTGELGLASSHDISEVEDHTKQGKDHLKSAWDSHDDFGSPSQTGDLQAKGEGQGFPVVIPQWLRRQAPSPPASLDTLIKHSKRGAEKRTPVTPETGLRLDRAEATQDPALLSHCSWPGNTFQQEASDQNSAPKWGKYRLDDTAKRRRPLEASVMQRGPAQTPPQPRCAGTSAALDKQGIGNGTDPISTQECKEVLHCPFANIPQQDYTGALSSTRTPERSGTSSPKIPLVRLGSPHKGTVEFSTHLHSAIVQNNDCTVSPEFQPWDNPWHNSPASNPGSWTAAPTCEGNSKISPQNLNPDVTTQLHPLNPNFPVSTGITEWQDRGKLHEGGKALANDTGVVEVESTMEHLTPSQNVAGNTPLHPAKRKRRWTEGKPTRWARSIKERWRDRRASQRKSGKEEDSARENGGEGHGEKGKTPLNNLSQEPVLLERASNTPTKEEESPMRGQSNTATTTDLEGNSKESPERSSIDFEFNFTPTNLLEEIFTGKEWSNYLHQPETEGHSWIQKNDQGEKMEQQGTTLGSTTEDRWNFKQGDANQNVDVYPMQISSCVVPTTNKEANEHMPVQSNMTSGQLCTAVESCHMQDRDQSQESIQDGTFDFLTKPVEILDSSALKSQVHLSRKREHHSGERRERAEEGKSMLGDSTVGTDLQTVDEGREDTANLIPLYILPSARSPLSPCSMLHSSETQDSSETVIKKRKLRDQSEDTRHVRFAEEPVFVPELQSSDFLPSETSGSPSLPGWILALKKKTRRKPRQ